MKYVAEIDIMPHKELLDPQGKAVQHSIGRCGNAVLPVRAGKPALHKQPLPSACPARLRANGLPDLDADAVKRVR